MSRNGPAAGHLEGVLGLLALLALGLLLQLFGPPVFHLWRPPASLIMGGLVAAMVLVGLIVPEARPVRWLSSPALAGALIAVLLAMGLLMGLSPQSSIARPSLGWPDRLGLTRLASSWPFVLTYLATLICLGLTTARHCRRPHPKFTFIINHLGLWLLLLTAALGAAERRSYSLGLAEGQVEWRGRTELGLVVELPLAIELHGFEVEDYPPQLAMIRRAGGHFADLPDSRLQIDPQATDLGSLEGWDLKLEDFLPRAERGPDGSWTESAQPGDNAPAALVSARRDREKYRGWISCGGSNQPLQTLELGRDLILTMTRPEPRRFSSDITVFTPQGWRRRGLVAVNRPLRLGPWMIYQHSYERALAPPAGLIKGGVAGSGPGNQSASREEAQPSLRVYSILEAVYDPWWPAVRVSLILMGLGALSLIWRGRR